MMDVQLMACTPNAEELCEVSARTCYSAMPPHDILTMVEDEGSTPGFLRGVIASGHHSVLEHAVFTFSVTGVSRSLSHQLVRHRMASYSQQSQRYVDVACDPYVLPPSIEGGSREVRDIYMKAMESCYTLYDLLMRDGVPREDARYVLPNASTTNITVTMNARELLHFFSLRCCNRAQWEIRELADRMLAICREECPIIFERAGPPCVRGPCPEGKRSCGKPRGGI